VTQAALQLLFGVLEMTHPFEMQNLSLNAINIALASPTLLAIACSGVLIGQERQTGCWTWSSSLPVSWRQSLLSKVIIWLGSSVVTMVLLLIVAEIALAMNQLSLRQQLFTQQAGYGPWTYLMTLVIGFQVYIYLSLATLLIKDTLMAIVVTAVGLFAFHLSVAVFDIEFLNPIRYGESTSPSHESTMLLAYLGSFILGSIGLVTTYRWRWGAGQYTSVSIFAGAAGNFARPQRAAWQSFAGSATQASEFGMLMRHGIRSSFGLRVTVMCGALLMIAVSNGSELSFMAASLAACVLGVSVFSGDQTLNRFRFFADRGVHWKKLLISHVAPPALLATIVTVLATIETARFESANSPELWTTLILCIPIFVIGMFSSLVFPSPIVSITVALVMVLGVFAFCGSALNIWQAVDSGHNLAIVVWFPLSTLILIVVAIRLVPRWLTKDRLDATGIYFGTMLVAGLTPLVFGLSFGFLQIPSVPWLGTPIEQIKVVDWTGGPELMRTGIVPERSSLGQHWDLQAGLTQTNLTASIRQQFGEQAQFPTWFHDRMSLLEAIENGGVKPDDSNSRVSSMLSSMIEGSAVVALMATEQRQKDLAIRAWKANRNLIAFCQQPALQPSTMQSVSFVWEIWNTLEDDDLQFLIETNELQNLTPVPRPTREQLNEVLRARGTIHRIMMMGNFEERKSLERYSTYSSGWYQLSPFQFYPPIRWAYERQQALALSEDLGMNGVQRQPFDYRGFHDYLVRVYAVLTFLESNFAGRLEKLKKL
jgi:hypothetical protein